MSILLTYHSAIIHNTRMRLPFLCNPSDLPRQPDRCRPAERQDPASFQYRPWNDQKIYEWRVQFSVVISGSHDIQAKKPKSRPHRILSMSLHLQFVVLPNAGGWQNHSKGPEQSTNQSAQQ